MTDAIDEFWAWWSKASQGLARTLDSRRPLSDEQIEALSERVQAVHESLSWEMGAGERSRHHLAVTAEGDAELRVVAERWLARAPDPSEAWEYYAARQASPEDAQNSLSLSGRTFDFDDFRAGLEVDEDHSRIHVEIYHPEFATMEDDELLMPTFLFLDDALGEDAVTSWIGRVETTAECPDESVDRLGLRAAVSELRAKSNDGTLYLLTGEVDGDPLISVMRLGLKRLDYLFQDHHWELTLLVNDPNEQGMPEGDEIRELGDFEDGLIEALEPRAVWIGRETHSGKRVMHFHADSSSISEGEVLAYCETHGHWQAELTVTHDPAWEILHRY